MKVPEVFLLSQEGALAKVPVGPQGQRSFSSARTTLFFDDKRSSGYSVKVKLCQTAECFS